jgi:hypothetical protein
MLMRTTNKPRYRKNLTVERLEDRSMMAAGLSAALSSTGVLTITGTSGADAITVHDLNSKVTIDGITSSYTASQVKSIVINGGGGNDKITLDNGGKAGGLGIAVTINETAGNDTLVPTTGASLLFGGTTSSSVSLTATGTATINGTSATWFDSNVQDAALRALGDADIHRDGVLSRADMMGLLRQAEKNGAMTASLLTDLKSIVNYAGNFSSTASSGTYVQQLAQNVVNGQTANATFQGKALGNLAVGSSAAQLENLTQKWFLGADEPVGLSDWGPTYAYANVSGQLFVNGVAYTDIQQGGCGDCYFLTALAETALKNPNAITSMFIVNGDGTYTVRFYNGSQAEYVTVDSRLPVDQWGRLVFDGMGHYANSSSNELWVALAEKAYAEMNQEGWLRPSSWGGGQNSYKGISGGYIEQAMAQILGAPTQAVALTNTPAAFAALAAAFNAGKEIGLSSLGSPANSAIVGGHAYSVVAVDTVNQTVTVYNPWGLNNGTQYSGLVTIKWSAITQSFSYISKTV